MKKRILEKRIRTLELANHQVIEILAPLFEAQKPKWGHWAMFALRDGLTADEAETLQMFWRVIGRQDQATLTKEYLLECYEAMVPPRLKGKLPAILQAERRDGTRRQYAEIVLGPDPEPRVDEGDGVSPRTRPGTVRPWTRTS